MVSETRRRLFACSFATYTSLIMPKHKTNALDVNSFIEKELASDKLGSTKKLTEDEALCTYGQPSKDRGDACVRAGMSVSLPGRSVNAYGEVDRGNFVRCKQFYELEESGYVKKTFCE